MEDQFDTSWIEDYENKEKELINQTTFAKEDIHNIKVYILYVNANNNLEKINILNQSLQNNMLDKQTLLHIIKSNMKR